MTFHTTENPRMIALVGVVAGYLFDCVLPVAQAVHEELARFIPPARRDRFQVVYVGVDIPPPVSVAENTVGVVARLVERKGHRLILEAWQQVKRSESAKDWRLIFWGDGPGRDAIEQALASVDDVDVIGPVPDAGKQVGRFPIVALPSLREGLPLVLVEAMAAGCAVIASDLPGCRELIGDDRGVLFPPGEVDELVDRLLTLMSDRKLRKRLGSAAQRYVAETFSRDAMIESYVQSMIPGPAQT